MLKKLGGKEIIEFNPKKQSPQNTIGGAIYLSLEKSAEYTQQYIHNQIIGTKNPRRRILNILKELEEYGPESMGMEQGCDYEPGCAQLKRTMELLLVIADVL